MSKQFIHTFRVQATLGSFPIDMLRYDSCFPATETDSGKIDGTLGFGSSAYGPEPVIALSRVGPASWEPCVERWESFGWSVRPERDRREVLAQVEGEPEVDERTETPCEHCGERPAEFVLYPVEYPDTDLHAGLCGHCIPENVRSS
jgi:hypothetical protein